MEHADNVALPHLTRRKGTSPGTIILAHRAALPQPQFREEFRNAHSIPLRTKPQALRLRSPAHTRESAPTLPKLSMVGAAAPSYFVKVAAWHVRR